MLTLSATYLQHSSKNRLRKLSVILPVHPLGHKTLSGPKQHALVMVRRCMECNVQGPFSDRGALRVCVLGKPRKGVVSQSRRLEAKRPS